MANITLGKRTRSSRETEPAASLDFSAKRARRTPIKNSQEEHVALYDGEDQENQHIAPDSPREAEAKPEAESTRCKAQSRRTSIATTVRSVKVAPVTPSTPRHYDVFARGTTTPRHRVMSAGRLSKRMTPNTPLTPSTLQTVYHQARALFSRSADPGQLIGRDDERAQLQAFLGRCKTPRPSGCLYVSGPPGTGKSAMVNRITEDAVSESESIKKAYINCMSIKSSKDLYITLLEQLGGEADLSEADVVAALEKLFLRKKATTDVFVVVLDEIDHILTMDPESLYHMFEWSLHQTSRLALVGVANALDLTDRFLPRLKSRNLKPELLPFLPYTAPQVKRIITERLATLAPADAAPDFLPFFHPAAVELCSRKVSSQTGDLRRAFEVCRRALDLVENETRLKHEAEIKEQLLQLSPSRKALGENSNLAAAAFRPSTAAQLNKSLQALTPATAPRVSIAHLNKITAAAFSNGPAQRVKTLNLQQKAALCSLLAIEKRNRAAAESIPTTPSSSTARAAKVSAPTIKSLYDAYSALCKQDSLLHPLSSSEFREVVGSLETLSLIAPVDGKNGSFSSAAAASSVPGTPSGRKGGRKKKNVFGGGVGGLVVDEKRVASCVGEREVEGAVEGLGEGILRGILSGDALDFF
ncbi:P-loop containing nucleoside triphosphate hydrolase protein [Staphylotrichum tortipilum]|uniref:Cell division control protein n=1 Tax=Staphylotrichum tortipilum TaxID=2831512 RepID=A0AAN6RXV9_9PEZI|nr:P-loop containing nucleoside triphosphate hydrolase protein [Staphylotrichum longicolle]